MDIAENLAKLVQIIFVDIVLAGDNAIVIGLVAARFSKEYRRKVIFYGVMVAVLLRILFALITVQLLAIPGLLVIGGLLLLWVCWTLWHDLRRATTAASDRTDERVTTDPPLVKAVAHIAMADVSMSLDNVLAVAGIADGHYLILVFGLVLSVAFMTIAAALVADILQRHRWIGYVGLAVIFYVALRMLTDGYHQFPQFPQLFGSFESFGT